MSIKKVGQRYRDFQVTKSFEIPELQCHLIELIHLPTNAQVMYIANQDPENLFCLSFQTLPSKSDGVAHILEHTVLCGSKKFPVKDPFFAMTRRSLNTFMNALTGSDFTCYPAASQVPKDFYNLLEVYIDAVFHPNLNKLSFLQEGHRLEFANPHDSNSLLERKGVVYNEMKGVLSSPYRLLGEMLHEALFPDITYGVNSGGNPKTIAELTYEQLVAFHQTFYHPSRCLFFFYGSLPIEGHLDFISKYALEGVEKALLLPPIPLQERFKEPKRIQTSYPISTTENPTDKTMISFGWLTCPIQEQQELLALDILQIVLMSTDASPLKKALLKSGLCKIASSHIDNELHEIPWIISLGGCNPENADACEQLIFKTLKELVEEGFPLELVENAIHQHEFHRSEIRAEGVPFGLSLFMRSALLKQHKVAPEEGLKIHSLFEGIRKKVLENANFFGDLIQKYLIDNPHFVRIVMVPDKELTGKELVEERAILDKIKKELTPIQVQELIQQADALASFQKLQENENSDILPKVTLEDVSPKVRNLHLKKEQVGILEVYHHDVFTNQIVYADLNWELPDISEEELPYLRLFNDLLTQLGAGGRTYSENLEFIQAHTGSIGATITFNTQAIDFHKIQPAIHLRGKALHRKAAKLFQLLKDLATSVDFTDKSRLAEILRKHYTSLETNLIGNAHGYAINLSGSGLSTTGKMSNLMYGIDYFCTLRSLMQNLSSNLDELIHKLKSLQNKVLLLENPQLVVTCEASMYHELKNHKFYGLDSLEMKPRIPWKGDFSLEKLKPQGRIIASPIAFIGKVFTTIPYVHPSSPALSVATGLFDNITLHRRIREEGGAYGGGAANNSLGGTFYFHSYRDPNISHTLEAFEESIKVIMEGNFSERELEEAKLEVIQGMDDPIKPGSRGDYAFLWLKEGRTPEIRQTFRDRLLSLKKEDIVYAVKNFIFPNVAKGIPVIFTSKELLEKENALLKEKGLPTLEIENL